MKRIVYACHAGSLVRERQDFYWVRMDLDLEPDAVGSSDFISLVDHIDEDLLDGSSVAIGFGAPLYLPSALTCQDFGKGRNGDGNRSIFSPVVSHAAIVSFQKAAFVLSYISGYRMTHDLTFDAASWATGDRPAVLVWEASVWGAARTENHDIMRDAATAAAYFHAHQENLGLVNAATCESPFSLIGAVALQCEWRDDPAILGEACLVLRPEVPYDGPIWVLE